jgi:hypothetical protein
MTMDEYFDLDEGLPILDPDGEVAATAEIELPGPRPRRRNLKGNTKAANADIARAAALREATGRAEPEVAGTGWRDHLKAGERGKASSALVKDGLTHNAGSGFGLA